MVSRLAITALATALLPACAVGPDFVKPEVATAATFARAPQASTAPVSADAPFWEAFGDPLLSALVADALRANHDLRIALARRDQADALLRGARFDRLPTITADGRAVETRASADQSPAAARADRTTRSHAAGIVASWELDLFGRIRRSVEAGTAEADASAADLRAAQVAVTGDVAAAYVELRGLQERLRVARANRDNQQRTLELVQARLDAGSASDFDVVRARAQREATAARIPALEAAEAVAMHRIAVLTGRTPDALIAMLSPPAPLPALPTRIDPGTPADVLRQRPDVAAAEARLHAATARIGIATADLFPRITLGGLLGSQAGVAGALFERESETRLLALGIDWSFLDVGRVRARIAEADASGDAALARYRQSVLRALQDTEDALVRLDRVGAEDAYLQRAAQDSTRAADLARVRYLAGATGLFEMLDVERGQLQAEDAFADVRTRSALNAIALYRALAGGWPQSLPQREPIADRR
ncbi:MAG TPA: efflux transporter outer membrane subunit [Thermomonas sp.]|nr:efflux transporter outer membrane subunit [Thermomonas sp.]